MKTENISHRSADVTVGPPAVQGVAHNLLQPGAAEQATLRLLAPTDVLQQVQDPDLAGDLLRALG